MGGAWLRNVPTLKPLWGKWRQIIQTFTIIRHKVSKSSVSNFRISTVMRKKAFRKHPIVYFSLLLLYVQALFLTYSQNRVLIKPIWCNQCWKIKMIAEQCVCKIASFFFNRIISISLPENTLSPPDPKSFPEIWEVLH